jgi:Mannosylglycerate synthase, GT domain
LVNVVAIPFLDEAPEVVSRNLELAASHPAIERVWAIHEGADTPGWAVKRSFSSIVEFVQEQRIGTFRSGKGDAMNTAIAMAQHTGVSRLHFYDADITNFGHDWIDGAQQGADKGYDVVRHSFPRAATDAMITWMVTKPGFAIKYPGTPLPRIGQPLGGEVLLTESAIATMAESSRVRSRSDWGIDTAITFTTAEAGHSLYEHHVPDGKRHALYGSLAELRDMAVECFDTMARLPRIAIPDIDHHSEPVTPVPADLQQKSGYSVDQTLALLTSPWADGEMEAVETLTPEMVDAVLRLQETGDFWFLDEEAWFAILGTAFTLGALAADSSEYQLFFRLWVGRVLNYTEAHASRGYEHALSYLQQTVDQYEAASRSNPTQSD